MSFRTLLSSLAGKLRRPIDTATVTLHTGSTLAMPAETGRSDQFYVSSQGTVDMQGAVILMEPGRVSTLENHGTLDSAGSSSGSGDALYGNLDNDGTLEFTGSLHMLMVSANPVSNSGGTFTQSSTGKLEVRVGNGTGTNDKLLNAGHVILDGELDVSEVSALTTGQRWTIISSSNAISGDFTTADFPSDGNPAWDTVPPGVGVTIYDIKN